MIVKTKIHEGTLELYDMLLNYFICKGGYPKKVKIALDNLYKVILDQMADYANHGKDIDADMEDIKTYYVEKGINGEINRIEIDWDCYMLYNLMVNYFYNKTGVYPKSVEKRIKKLEKALFKVLPSNDLYLKEDVQEVYTEQQMTFKN